jgi:phosphate transport system substrate-binding protein
MILKNRYRWIIFGWTSIILMSILGCIPERKESPTKGNIMVAVSESILPVIKQEEQRFEEWYPDAHVDLIQMTAREAITRLFNDTVKVVVTSRPLNAEEREVAKKSKLDFQEYKIAIDGIAIIINAKNPVQQLRTTQLDSILRGLIKHWNVVGGVKTSIEICLPNRNSGTFEVVGMKILKGGNFSAPAQVVETSPGMLQFVSEHPDAIGMIGVNWLREKNESIKILELSDPVAPDSLGIQGKYFAPFQAHIYRGYYPITREIYIYSKADMYSVGSGFISFITSAPGQQIVLNNGLVPATMPIRLVELTNKGIPQ